jgi:hypothetical protein
LQRQKIPGANLQQIRAHERWTLNPREQFDASER